MISDRQKVDKDTLQTLYNFKRLRDPESTPHDLYLVKQFSLEHPYGLTSL